MENKKNAGRHKLQDSNFDKGVDIINELDIPFFMMNDEKDEKLLINYLSSKSEDDLDKLNNYESKDKKSVLVYETDDVYFDNPTVLDECWVISNPYGDDEYILVKDIEENNPEVVIGSKEFFLNMIKTGGYKHYNADEYTYHLPRTHLFHSILAATNWICTQYDAKGIVYNKDTIRANIKNRRSNIGGYLVKVF